MSKIPPLSIVLCALINNNHILLIKRIKGDYINLLGLPGGKIELDEHISQSAKRELKEESGIDSTFKEYNGVISEQLKENNQTIQHFILHLCTLVPKTTEITKNIEGNLNWYNLDTLKDIKHQIIPSDYLIIKKMLIEKQKTYFDCIISKKDNNYTLEIFE
jgi:ADP-ribose pyrophosphatase YjhB (NUDIX family)